MSDEAVGPALTPEEWTAGHYAGLDVNLYRKTAGFDGSPRFVVEVLASPIGGSLGTPQDSHALAAFALHRQPFGFSQRMVDLLNWTADNWQMTPFAKGGFGSLSEPDPREELRSLAARIAALLPPTP